MSVNYFSAHSWTKHTLSKAKAVTGAREVKIGLLCLYVQIRMNIKDANAGNWRVREAKAPKACGVPAT
jgi:hypothetical protein